MSPRRLATAERSWFRLNRGATAGTEAASAEATGLEEQPEGEAGTGASGGRNSFAAPLAAPTPPSAAEEAGTSPEAEQTPGAPPETGSASTPPAVPGSATPSAATPAEPAADDAEQPLRRSAPGGPASSPPAAPGGPGAPGASPPEAQDAPTLMRPAPWVNFGGIRRGTARTRAAEADLAARASAIALPPEVTTAEPQQLPPPQPFPAQPLPPQPFPQAPLQPPVGPRAEEVPAAPAHDATPGTPDAPFGPVPDHAPGFAEPAAASRAAAETDTASPPADGPAQALPVGLSARLMALATMIDIGSARSGPGGFTPSLLTDAEAVLARAGERMRLSASHTVVVLAGGTGSGKSSLFNRMAGADFSTVGVTRPVTTEAHACVWGEQGAEPILEWLGVPSRYRYSRASALDRGEEDLAGLVLLDLPDHDSVISNDGEVVGQLVGMADVMVWVLDPQKYADAAVHRRFLVPLAGHSAVVAVILNQVDLIDPSEVDDCVADLRRLLDSENLHDVPIVVTSATTGVGLDELRALLATGVASRRAAATRITADLDGIVARFLPFARDTAKGRAAAAEESVPATTLAEYAMTGLAARGSSASSKTDVVPAGSDATALVSLRGRLAERFADAAGVVAIGEALRSARELRAIDFVGWPIAWFAQRLTGRGRARKAQIGALWSDLRAVTAGPAGAQQAEIDNALTQVGADLARSLPAPWSATVKSAVRSHAEEIPAAIGKAIGEALPSEDTVAGWWRLAGLWQGLLLGAAAVAVAWSLLIVVVRMAHAEASMPGLMSELGAVPWLVGVAIAALALGAGTTWLCMKAVASTAEQESDQITVDLRDRIAAVAQELAIAPAEQEVREFLRYRDEARIASSGMEIATG